MRHGNDDEDLQLHSSELSDEDCGSDDEEREAVGVPYLTDDDESSSVNNYLDAEEFADQVSNRTVARAETGERGVVVDSHITLGGLQMPWGPHLTPHLVFL